jgi:hypothetical protein
MLLRLPGSTPVGNVIATKSVFWISLLRMLPVFPFKMKLDDTDAPVDKILQLIENGGMLSILHRLLAST